MSAKGRLRELRQEFRTVVVGRSRLADSLAPPLIFIALNATLGLTYASWGALACAAAITLYRLVKGQPISYAVGGLGAASVAISLAWLLGRAEGYFLPGIIQGFALCLLAMLSGILGRPMVAWTSHLARGWPLRWYWHPRVRPAYSEVTFVWAAWFGARAATQWFLYRRASTGLLTGFNVITGWPATIVLLAGSYLYGIRRLGRLKGPGVDEFKRGADPPWGGQKRGF